MADFLWAMRDTCEKERDRLAVTEIAIDEALTIMDRHGVSPETEEYRALRLMSSRFHQAFFPWSGDDARLKRMIRVRETLTKAFPLDDDDLKPKK